MKSDSRDDTQHTAFPHQVEPMAVQEACAAENGFPAAVPCPIGSAADHLAEKLKVRIFAPVPVRQVVRFVPELDMAEIFAVAGQHMIDEIRIELEILGRSV